MITSNSSVIDYEWKQPKAYSNEYVLKTLVHIFNKFKIPSGIHILDAGCGGGYLTFQIYDKGYRNIWGIDISQSGISIAKESYKVISDRFECHNLYEKNLPFNLPIPEYDLIISSEVIEHLYSPQTYLENVNLWLKKDGYLIITTPYHGYFKNLLIAILNKSDRHFNPTFEGGHIKFFSKKMLCKMLEQNGFMPVKFYGSGRFPLLWKSMIIISKKI